MPMRPRCLPALLAILVIPAAAANPPEADYLLASQLQPMQAAVIKSNPYTPGSPWLEIGVHSQSLVFYDARGVARAHYTISTAKNGVGEQANSYQTPRGWHRVCERIGDGVTPGTIIYRRQVTPWMYTAQLHQEYPDKDWILTRILWLCGMEPGKNLGGTVDSYDRAIYIHGAGEHVAFGTPTSRGCIRMRNEDIVELFAQTGNGLDVLINENL
ncbi:L,D-transpeptidase [Vogesella oryzae]|uniref:L,D-transpeptidase n=1 Tax=Vogesella oryzae TaxID=1735285 RepID=UPI001FE2F514|nr:L,D-transpeptidase [Vogesella oryzae]